MDSARRALLFTCLHPLRRRILEAVSLVPGSGQSLARRLGEGQPKVHYHLKKLEAAGLVHVVEERKKRGMTERLYGAEAGALEVPGEEGAEVRTLRLTPGQAHQLREDLTRLIRQYQAREGGGGMAHRFSWSLTEEGT